MQRLDFINKVLCQRNEARTYISNVDEAIIEYYRDLKNEKLLPLERQLSDCQHSSEDYFLQWVQA